MNRTSIALTALALACTVLPAQAAIVNHADVGGFRTFQDTSTGLVWADLDNFWTAAPGPGGYAFATHLDYLNTLTAAGFAWATTAEVNAFVSTVSVSTPAERQAVALAMVTDRGLQFETLLGFANAGDSLKTVHALTTAWIVGAPATWSFATQYNAGIWAYVPSASGGGGNVPEPASLALVGLALMAATAASRRKRGLADCA